VLSSEIKEILAMDREERLRLGAFCRDFVREHYSVDTMVESQLSVYRRLCEYPVEGDPDVLLCGYYGYGNLGDESILSVIIRELRARDPGVRICVLSANPKETAAFHMVDAIHRFDLVEIQRKMKKTKLFLFGGGSLLQDKTSNRSLSYYIHMLRMAKKSGAKIAVFANGIGPILREKNRIRVRDALSLADTLSFRDIASLDFCRAHCPEKEPRLVFDPVILETGVNTGAKRKCFFAVIPKKTTSAGEEHLKRAIAYMIQEKGLRPMFISLFDAEDGEYTKRLAREFDAEYALCREAEVCMDYLSRAGFLLSSRLHGLVYATAACCPMLALTDDVKLLSYMGTIGFGEGDDVSLACKDSDGEARLLECMDSLLANEAEIRAHILKNLPVWRAMAESELHEITRFLT
jgi:polysaccharide pyruvyl transferase CsaB